MNAMQITLEPEKLYSARDACDALPEGRKGKRIHPGTLNRWRREGRLKGVRCGLYWFFWGHELLRFLGSSEPVPRSEQQAEKAVNAAREQLKRLGLKHY